MRRGRHRWIQQAHGVGFPDCPDDLTQWLVEHGADVNAPDAQRRTPLHHRSESWQGPAQHQELWDLLVPSGGSPPTMQGEVIRISGRVAHEVLDNGAVNWGPYYRDMIAALVTYLGNGTQLPAAELAEAASLARPLRSGKGGRGLARLAELSVLWVLLNPQPIPLPRPDYDH